jgi:hypothetical protein
MLVSLIQLIMFPQAAMFRRIFLELFSQIPELANKGVRQRESALKGEENATRNVCQIDQISFLPIYEMASSTF